MKWLAILFGILIYASMPGNAVALNPVISSEGTGTETVAADWAILSVTVESTKDNMTAAREEAKEKINEAKNALLLAGAAEEEILPGTSSGIRSYQSSSRACKRVNNSTVCSNDTTTSASLSKTLTLQLKGSDEARIKELIDAAESAGAIPQIEGYGLTDPSKALERARQKAVENARENAEGIAKAAGATLGKVLEIYNEGSDLNPSESTGSDKNQKMIDVTAYVAATWELGA